MSTYLFIIPNLRFGAIYSLSEFFSKEKQILEIF